MALAAAAAFFTRSRSKRRTVGAVIIDHGLQAESSAVAERTRQNLEALGLSAVLVRSVHVAQGTKAPGEQPSYAGGLEAAAREARYTALAEASREWGAAAVLLGHTRDDQAEQVLLGLARGSGTRSLAGMPARREFHGEVFLRPFLSLSRAEIEQLCELEGLNPWQDPSNADPAFARSRVRHRVLPELELELGPGIAAALARSASILSDDADLLDTLAAAEFSRLAVREEPARIAFDLLELRALPTALRRRVLALATTSLGGEQPSFERLLAVESLLEGGGSAGPVQLAGKVAGCRRRAGGYARLVLQQQ